MVVVARLSGVLQIKDRYLHDMFDGLGDANY